MKTEYIYYGIIAAIVAAIGVVVYLVIQNQKQGNTPELTITDTAAISQATANTPQAPAPCNTFTRTSWMQDNSIRPGYVRIDYCDGTSETVPGNF